MKIFWLAWCFTVATAVSAAAQCAAPRYRTFQNATNKLGGSMNLSIKPADVSLDKLLCLAQTLGRQRTRWKGASVFIFTSDEAAKSFRPVSASATGDDQKGLRARIDINDGRQSLTITPIGYAYPYSVATVLGSVGSTVFNTRIDLPAAGTAHCRLEINGRCVFALEAPQYPKTSGGVSGKVSLMGTADRDGKVTVTIDPASGGQQDESDPLVRAALENLRSWWLEPARRQDTFRMTYSYVVDQSLRPDQFDVKFALPDLITIRANPAAR